ncbi:hypothetical protein OS493_005788 [Desmophyllum pertusum]|uniref:Uncharacterized protein n=1 Tax=Desmophyllum pertusum TaxID=174260 RepID=A0A9W9YIF4_9CNID|nr:hypothetical protein OS493_005788 [Desmophyllum pertusum]
MLRECLDIRADIPDSLSGLHSIQPIPGGKVITVYSEMAIARGGFTFVPRTAIRGILPANVAGVDGKIPGFQSNGKALRYTNCGGSKDNLLPSYPIILNCLQVALSRVITCEKEWQLTGETPLYCHPRGAPCPISFSS